MDTERALAKEDARTASTVFENSTKGSWYLVSLCMVAYIFSFIDRQIVVLLVEEIRADLHISDTQFSLIHGLSFAIFYALMGLPIARLADTRSRPAIIAVGIAVWSAATAACGLTRSFWQLFVARMAVGAGEAALSPAAYSMISDSFPRSQLGLALGVYSIGSFIGAGLAFVTGGVAIQWVTTHLGVVDIAGVGTIKPWQMTFFIVGLPGLILAALFLITVKDPQRKGATSGQNGYPLREVMDYLKLNRRTFFAHYVGFGLLSLQLFALLSWAPAFLLRNYDMSTREVGLTLGTIVLVCNVLGVLCSGWLLDLLTRRGHTDAALRSAMFGALGSLIPVTLFPFVDQFELMLVVLGLALFFASFPMATSAAALQAMAPNQMRAQVTAIFFLFMNLLGITGGASLVALCTDYLFRDEMAVGFSMALVAFFSGVLALWVIASGLNAFRETVEKVDV